MLVDSFKAFITSGRQHSISFKVGHSQQFHLITAHLNSLEQKILAESEDYMKKRLKKGVKKEKKGVN